LNLSNFVFTVVAAAACVLLLDQSCVRIREALRSQRYTAQRKRRRELFAGIQVQFNFPSHAAEQRTDGLFELVAATHTNSVAAQDRYQREIARSAACLGLAFTALAANVTLVHDLHRIQSLLAWIDLIALGCALFHFVMARRALSPWIEHRSRSELLRQYAFLSPLFPSSAEMGADLDLTSAFEAERDRIDRGVLLMRGRDLIEAIVTYWDHRRSAILSANGEHRDISTNILRLYIERRCLRQLAWFRASIERLQRTERDRTRLLSFLFWLSIFLASLKAIMVTLSMKLNPAVAEFLAFAVLMATGGAAAMSALHYGQNIRSLIHRYRAQEHDINRWLDTFARVNRETLMRDEPQLGANAEVRRSILVFEDLMVKELVDWMHISEHDSIELGP
jgi:hypothetical protein